MLRREINHHQRNIIMLIIAQVIFQTKVADTKHGIIGGMMNVHIMIWDGSIVHFRILKTAQMIMHIMLMEKDTDAQIHVIDGI